MANTEFFKNGTVTFVWYSLAYLPVGLPVLKEAWESILQKDIFSEFTLMSVATLGAFYIREYPEGVAVMLFYSLGELFQNKGCQQGKAEHRRTAGCPSGDSDSHQRQRSRYRIAPQRTGRRDYRSENRRTYSAGRENAG